MTKYIAYCRKSRDEADRQILSIEAQIAELKEFARKEHIEIVEFVTEAKTAKMPGREQFALVLKKIEKGEVNGIVAWHPDRLARNSIDGGRIVYLLDTGKLLDLKFPTFWFDNTPQGKFMLSIAFGQSKYYIDNLSENVRRGLRQKLRNGVWPGKATYGYVNNPKTRGIDTDPVASAGILKAYELFVSGNYSFTDISNFLFKYNLKRKNGKTLHHSEIHKILSDKFYLGIMYYNGEYYEGTHEKIIPKELFDKVQEQVKKLSRSKEKRHQFAFVGLAKCGECGASITAETHTKYYKGTNRNAIYNYYRCTRKIRPCKQASINEYNLEGQLRQIVFDVPFPSSWADTWLNWLERDEKLEISESQGNIEKLKLGLENLNKQAEILLDGYLDQVIDPETYKNKKNEIFEQKLKIQEEIIRLGSGEVGWIEPMRNFIKTAETGAKIARAKNNLQELGVLAKNIGLNFTLLNRQIKTDYKKGFDTLFFERAGIRARSHFPTLSVSVGEGGLEPPALRSQSAHSNQLSYSPVPREGVEPTRRCYDTGS